MGSLDGNRISRLARVVLGAGSLLVVSAGGCNRHLPPVASPPPAPPPPTPAPPAGWRALAYPREPFDFYRVRGAAGVLRLRADGYRIEVGDDGVRFAEEVLLYGDILPCPSGPGWLHVGGDEVFWSEEFLGNLERVGQTMGTRVEQCGPVVVVKGENGKLELASREGVRVLPAAPAMRYLRFSSSTSGHAIAYPDLLLATRDGGATWTAPARRPTPDLPEKWVGKLDARNDDYESPSDATEHRVLAAWLDRAIASDVGSLAEAAVRPDGTRARSLVLMGEHSATVVAIRTQEGRVSSHLLDGVCRVRGWGQQLLADCSDQLFLVDAREVTPLPALPHTGLVMDRAGKWLAANYDDPDPFAETGSLHVFDGTTWRDTEQQATPLGISGDTILLSDPGPPSYRLATLPGLRPRGPALDDLGDVSRSDLQLFDDSVLVVRRNGSQWTEDATAELEWIPLDEDAERVARPLPGATSEVGFADRQHGAVALSNGSAVVTSDGGRTWHPQASDPYSYSGSGVECWADGCVVNEQWIWTRLPVDPEPGVLLPTARDETEENPVRDTSAAATPNPPPSPPPSPPLGPMSGRRDPGLGRFTCAMPSLPVEEISPWLAAMAAAQSGAANAVTIEPSLPVDNGWIRFTSAGSVAWRGNGPGGDFAVEVAVRDTAAQFLQRCRQFSLDNLHGCLPRLVAPTYSVWSLSAYDEGWNELWVLRDDGEMDRIFVAQGLSIRTLLVPSGGALIAHDRQTYVSLVELDPRGIPARERWALGSDPDMLAYGPEGPGLVYQGQDAPAWLTMERGSTLVPLSPLPHAPDLCRQAAAVDARYVLMPGGVDVTIGTFAARGVTGNHGPSYSTAEAIVEIAPGRGPCLREARVRGTISTTITAHPGRLSATLLGAKRSHPLWCKWQPPTPPRPE